MRPRIVIVPTLAVVALIAGLTVSPVSGQDGATDWLIERTSADAGTSGGRELPAITPNGRYLAYVGRGEGAGIWLTDRQKNATRHLTTGMDFNPAISDDGRFVAFARYGSDRQVLLIDTSTAAISTVSVSSGGAPGTGLSDFPSISADGRFVAFQSTATNLDPSAGDPGSGGGPTKVYLRDRLTGQTRMVSVNDSGQAAQGNAFKPDITPDGRYVAFASDAGNLVAASSVAAAEEETTVQQVFLRDTVAGTTEMVSIDSGEVPGTAISSPLYGPSISADARFVAFESLAPLVTDDTNGDIDAYVRDRTSGTTVRVSVLADGTQADLPDPDVVTEEDPASVVGAGPAISGDGTMVAFESAAALTPDDANGVVDPYLHSLAGAGTTRLGLAAEGGSEATGTRIDGRTGLEVPQTNGYDVTISRDGRYVSFVSNGDLAADRPTEEDAPEGETSTEPAVFTRTTGLPTVTAVVPAAVDVTKGATVTISGTNFSATPIVDFGPGITVDSVTWLSSTSAEAKVSVRGSAALGPRSVQVQNPGGDSAALASGFTVTANDVPNWWYVRSLYQDFLGREPDGGGLEYWTAQLDQGVSPTQLMVSLTGSQEYLQLLVTTAYDDVLGRGPDAAGLAYWTNQLAAGMQWEQLKIQLLGSAEYYANQGGTPEAFVQGVFEEVLGRSVDAQGLAYFTDRLQAGTPRTTVAAIVVRSREAAQIVVRDLYQRLLHRAPDPGGLEFWTTQIMSGESAVTTMRRLAASPEYYLLAQPVGS